MESLKEKISKAREAVVPRIPRSGHTAYETLLRRFSIYVSYFLCRLGVTGNQVTVAMALCGIAGGLCFIPRNIYINVAGILLWHMEFFLDLVDGEVARLQKKSSVLGVYFDFAAHQIATPFIALGFGMHVYLLDKSILILPVVLLLYSVFHWRRALTSAKGAVLYKVGHRADIQREKTEKEKGNILSQSSVFSLLGRSLFTVYATTLTGLCLVASYFVGTKILYVYLITYTALATLVFMAMVLRDALNIRQIRIEQKTEQAG